MVCALIEFLVLASEKKALTEVFFSTVCGALSKVALPLSVLSFRFSQLFDDYLGFKTSFLRGSLMFWVGIA
ncbi:MAG: hypothetical protein COV66_02270 [Nitrospinae bacterium CG11_big_fil_rev_8_21_14_0_20_45_15]|nr:MAG: hypothetical protein COV66_02270 [Nitrospinae bacterium CG11_big_fil_rev_8_21_14_0_20_45_15]